MYPTYTFFRVAKGHMTLVQFSNGVNILVDCHYSPECLSPLDYLKAKISSLDIIVITHPHQDHLTGLKEVATFFRPRALWHNGRLFRPDPVYDDWIYYELLRAGKVSGCTSVALTSGQKTNIGGSNVHIAGPESPWISGTQDDENNNSIVLAIETGHSKVVLTGDTEQEQWDAMDLKPLANASILLASHHGREDGYSERALKVIRPQHIIVSDGDPCGTDATAKYRRFASVSTTRDRSIVVRQSQVATVA
jgi:competence protein ComEC